MYVARHKNKFIKSAQTPQGRSPPVIDYQNEISEMYVRREGEEEGRGALKNGTYMFCGEPCEKDMFCGLYKTRMYKYKMIPGPCLGCGIGLDDYRYLCQVCEEKRRQTTYSENLSPAPKPEEKIKNGGPSRAKFDMLTFDDEFCFGLRA